MAANTAPIYALTPNSAWCTLTTANTAKDGTGTVGTCFTAGANGAYLKSVFARPQGTQVPSVLRLFLNNGSTNATAGNNALFKEITLPTITNSEVAAVTGFEIPVDILLPATYKMNAVVGTTVAGWIIIGLGGDY